MGEEVGAWCERQRLIFIERLLYWRGYINRRDLCNHFGISAPQATNDLVTYSTLCSGGCQYNVRRKRYEATEGFEPRLTVPDFGLDMKALGASGRPEGEEEFVVFPEMPVRAGSPGVFRKLSLAAHEGQSVEIHYWSVSSGTARWRTVSPRTFGYDGLRWHVRALCHDHEEFRDFTIGRIRGIRNLRECPFRDQVDKDWQTYILMKIRPNPKLSDNQRKALEMDYGMVRGVLQLSVRAAMLLYTRRRLGFIREDGVLPILNEMEQLELFAEDPV